MSDTKRKDNRQVYLTHDLPIDIVEELKNASPPSWTASLNHLMEPNIKSKD